MNGQPNVSAALLPGKSALVCTEQGLGRPWSRSGSFGKVNTLLVPAFERPVVQTAGLSLYWFPVEGGGIF
jgi:hypothetical protein